MSFRKIAIKKVFLESPFSSAPLKFACKLPKLHWPEPFQWNPKYGCKGTVTTRFALIALVAWQY